MYCILKGKVCIMVFNEQKNRYCFIRSVRWQRMSEEQKAKYRIDF